MSQKHILISGATGFLGSYLTHAFVARGDEVTILKRNTSNTERIADILSAVRSVNTDVDPVELAFENYSAYDVVINTVGIYGRRGESAAAILQSNLCFAVELLQLSSKYNAKKFINTNTSADSMLNDYALAKRQFSDWGRLYTRQSDMAIYDILLEHMYGPGDDTKKFIEFIIEKCRSNVAELPLTKGEQLRDFVYIDDVVNAYLLLADAQMTGYQQLGLGSGKNITIRELVELIHHLTKSTTKLDFGALPYRGHEAMESRPDLTILQLLGWQADVDMKTGIQKILGAGK